MVEISRARRVSGVTTGSNRSASRFDFLWMAFFCFFCFVLRMAVRVRLQLLPAGKMRTAAAVHGLVTESFSARTC